MGAVTDLAGRYGSPRRTQRMTLVAVVVALAVAGLAWLLWAGLGMSNPLVQSQLVSFSAPHPHSVTARVTVARRDSDVVANCVLRAAAADHSVVGELTFTVGPGGPAKTTQDQVVRTERVATSVELLGCTAPGQKRPR